MTWLASQRPVPGTVEILGMVEIPNMMRGREWTFMVYIDADSYNDYQDTMNALELAGSTPDLNIVVMVDGTGGTGGWYEYVTQHSSVPNPESGNLVLVEKTLAEPNMGDPHTLDSFINWAKRNYPGKKYALVLWDHGAGWHGVCSDWTWRQNKHGNWVTDEKTQDLLTTVQLRTALSKAANSGSYVNLIVFNACCMASIEVAYEIKDCCDVMVGSEQETGGGYPVPYAKILSALALCPTMSPAELGTMICKEYYANNDQTASDLTYSAIDLKKMDGLASSIANFRAILINNLSSSSQTIIEARAITREMGDVTYPYPYADLYSFALAVSALSDCSDLKEAADAVLAAFGEAVMYNVHGVPDQECHGLTIYFPKDKNYPDNRHYGIFYSELAFEKNTLWHDFINNYLGMIPAP